MKKISALLLLPLAMLGQKPMEYPATEKSNTTDDYFGAKIADPYRWLEEVNSPKTIAWLEEQEKVAVKYSKKLAFTVGINTRLQKYGADVATPLVKKGKYFFHTDDPENPTTLYYRLSPDDADKPAFTTDNFRGNASRIPVIKQFELSADDRFVAFSISHEDGNKFAIHTYNIDKQRMLPEVVEHAVSASIGWHGNGFFYMKNDSAKTTIRLFYHKVGNDPRKDLPVYTFNSNDMANAGFEVSNDEKYLVLHDLIKENGETLKGMLYAGLDMFPTVDIKPFITTPLSTNGGYRLLDNIGNKFLLITDIGSPARRIVMSEPTRGISQPREIVKAYKNTLVNASYSQGHIICLYHLNGAFSTTVFDTTGKSLKTFNFPVGCTVRGFDARYYDQQTYYYVSSFYFPTTVYKFDTEKLTSEPQAKSPINFDPNKFETKVLKYKTADSLDALLYLTCKKGMKPDGTAALLLRGEENPGNYINTAYDPGNIIWIENGGVLAVIAIQDKKWKTAGVKNGLSDFIMAANYLSGQKYVNRDKMAIEGSCFAGWQASLAMTQQPDLFKAVITDMPLTDMLRYQHFHDVFSGAYGSSDHKEGFEKLGRYTPLQAIRKDVKYPATLVIADNSNHQAAIQHSYKFIAGLQENGLNTMPYILKQEKKAGQSAADILKTDQESTAYKLGFLFKNLDIDASAVFSEQ
ncbi:MAG: S9 family peptidase [Bacteroidetes bacterium]|nr:S9 family peptidase [Bacteroidota bacterium]